MNSTRRKLMAALPLAASASAAGKPSAKRVYYVSGKPASTPLYSEVIGLNNLVFISGHGVDTPGDVKGQTTAVLDKIEACLRSAGSSMEKVVKCNVFLRHLADYAAMNEAYLGRFGTEPPVRTTVAVVGLPLAGCLVEIEVIAAR